MLSRYATHVTFVIIVFMQALSCWADTSTKKILVLGDSLSAGYGIDVNKGWVSLLAQRLADTDQRVINASVSGETTGGGLARLPALLQEHNPDLVIVELGGNDGLRGLSLNIMEQNLEAIVNQVKAHDAQILLLGMKIPPNYGQRYTQLFEHSFSKLAQQTGVAFVPFFLEDVAGHPELVQADGIHPRVEAQTTLLDNIWPTLKPLVTENEQ